MTPIEDAGLTASTAPLCFHGEGPLWDPRTETLFWLDMLAGDVLHRQQRAKVEPAASRNASRVMRTHLADTVAAIRPRASGGFVLGVDAGFLLVNAELAPDGPVLPVWVDKSVRMNEGACDPQGRFYCGSMARDATPGRGALYRLDPDRSVHRVLSQVSISNGLEWSNDGRRVFYVDTPTGCVDVFDFDAVSGTLHERRPHIRIRPEDGKPDGICLDSEGGLWVALWGGGAVHRYDADGILDEVINLPVSQVTACAFGGPHLDHLYITTSCIDIDTSRQPQAGALFVAEPGVTGLPVRNFAG